MTPPTILAHPESKAVLVGETAGGFPANGNYGNAFLKLSTSGALAVADYFEMSNQHTENDTDTDLGSGGALVLPDLDDGTGTIRHLAVGAGKDGHIYVVNPGCDGEVQQQEQ